MIGAARQRNEMYNFEERWKHGLFQQWVSEWSDSVEFESIPVVAGTDTAIALLGQDAESI